jgi:hypothetical protein
VWVSSAVSGLFSATHELIGVKPATGHRGLAQMVAIQLREGRYISQAQVRSWASITSPNSPKVDGKINTLAAFRRSEEAEDWKRLMSDHLVRRTRSFIKRTAKKESVLEPNGQHADREFLQFATGEKFFFPTRVARPLSHDFSDTDPARLMEDDTTLDAVRALILPRYRLAEYDNPTAPHSATDKSYLDDIRAGRGNVSGFVRIGLFKRFSSSGRAFILSLQRQRARNELFIYAIDSNPRIPLGTR